VFSIVSEAKEDTDSVHEPAAGRAGAALWVSEVPHTSRPRRHRLDAPPLSCTGHHVVPEQTRQAETRLGGAEGRRRGGQGAWHRAVDGGT